jgi:hypothetical protein
VNVHLRFRNGLVLLCAAAALSAARGGTDADRTYAPAKVSPAPRIDGNLDEGCWTTARKALFRNGNVPTTAALCNDEQALYIAVDCSEPTMGQLKSQSPRRDDPVWGDDCIEVFVAPDYLRQGSYYHFAVNPRGTMADGHIDLRFDYAWNGSWLAKTRQLADRWTVEMRIPFADLGIKTPEDAPLVGVAICRTRRAAARESGTEWSLWQIGGSFHEPAGHVLLGSYETYVQRSIVGPWGERRKEALELTAANGNAAGPESAVLRGLVQTLDRECAALPPHPTADNVNALVLRYRSLLDALLTAERQARFAGALARLRLQAAR